MKPDRCYWVRDEDGTEIMIPMCAGSAALGFENCTCATPESRIEAAERGRAEAERQVLRLREARDRMLFEQKREWHHRQRLRKTIRDLQARIESGKA